MQLLGHWLLVMSGRRRLASAGYMLFLFGWIAVYPGGCLAGWLGGWVAYRVFFGIGCWHRRWKEGFFVESPSFLPKLSCEPFSVSRLVVGLVSLLSVSFLIFWTWTSPPLRSWFVFFVSFHLSVYLSQSVIAFPLISSRSAMPFHSDFFLPFVTSVQYHTVSNPTSPSLKHLSFFLLQL
ncbi:hypothetical protein BDN72DRAFT_345770 [Pluteus cervinus]|uniref:Uncharacterized protein n=1 Tax=Pluteus cervinus TaxID=181527 RepID=A0ACD3AB73_9AGAR|nr:hypothetical protein BDN72DRAFT_345770 [Pluteus cervinus]